MSILHSLQHSHDQQRWFQQCLDFVQHSDGIILLEDAVNICTHKSSIDKIIALNLELKLYVIDCDIEARGLSNAIIKPFEVVSYQDFVELSLEYDKVINWA